MSGRIFHALTRVLLCSAALALAALLFVHYIARPVMAEHDRLMNEPIVDGSLEQWRDAKRRATNISGCWEWSEKVKRFVVYKLKDC